MTAPKPSTRRFKAGAIPEPQTALCVDPSTRASAAEACDRSLVDVALYEAVFGVTAGVGGIVGALLTGVFAVEQYGGTAGALEGNVGQFFNQCIGVATVFVYDAVVSLIILFVIKMVVGLRVSEETEREGLDLALHGEVVQ